ncbi:MAG: Hsp20/alpha crystallin family protein [Bacteroidota bacterium]
MTFMKPDQRNLLPSFSNIWDDFFRSSIADFASRGVGTSLPAVNIEEKADKFLVHLAAPGMKREDFKIEIDADPLHHKDVLSISAEKEEKHEEKDQAGEFTRREFSYQNFSRTFEFGKPIKADAVAAKYEDGILTIHLPKHEEAQVKPIRQIEVQ